MSVRLELELEEPSREKPDGQLRHKMGRLQMTPPSSLAVTVCEKILKATLGGLGMILYF